MPLIQNCKFEGATMNEDIKCKESFTPQDVCSLIIQAHSRFVNSELFMSEYYEQNFAHTKNGREN